MNALGISEKKLKLSASAPQVQFLSALTATVLVAMAILGSLLLAFVAHKTVLRAKAGAARWNGLLALGTLEGQLVFVAIHRDPPRTVMPRGSYSNQFCWKISGLGPRPVFGTMHCN